MQRLYIRMFLGFWLITILMLIASSITLHMLNLAPNQHLSQDSAQSAHSSGGKLLREMVSDAINHDYRSIQAGLKAMPQWATRIFYLVDEDGKDMLQRPIPSDINPYLERLSPKTPYFRKKQGEKTYFGRQFTTTDGVTLKAIVFSPASTGFLLRLYLNNFWHILLFNVLLSGAACYYLARFITRDIRTLKEATQQIAQGNWDTRVSKALCYGPGELAELGTAFDKMVVKLQQTMLEQKRLIKDVSHELRTPLARLQVALAIAQQRANSEITDELDQIKRAADYLNDVISDILTLPMTQQDDWTLDDVVEACSLIAAVTDANSHEAAENQVKLRITDRLEEALINTRGNTLVGVIDNVLRNAIRYSPPNTEVTINLDRTPEGLCRIAVSDQGPGVREDQLEAIFEPFFRTDEARCRKSGGHGLGLAIAKRTILLHKGTVSAQNRPSGGLTITIVLPCCDDEMM